MGDKSDTTGGDKTTFGDVPIGVGGEGMVTPRPRTPMTTISKQDLDILREGSSELAIISQRNVLLGILASALTSSLGLYASVDVFKLENGNIAKATVMFALLILAALATGIGAWFRHSDAQRVSNKGVYHTTTQRIGRELDDAEKLSQQQATEAQQVARAQAAAAQQRSVAAEKKM